MGLAKSVGMSGIPVEFSTSSTVQAVSAPGTGSTVEAHLVDTTSTIPVSTVIESTKVGKDTSGTIGYLLTDTSERLITSPSSTIQAVTAPSGTQDVSIVESITLPTTTTSTISTIISSIEDTTSTRPVSFILDTTSTRPVTFSTPVSVTATDLDIRDLSSVTDSVSIPTSSTVQVANFPTTQDVNLVNTTGTVEIGDKTGFELSTTSTIPVEFAPSSTVQAVSAPGTGSTVEAHLITTTATIPVTWTGEALSTTSTVPVSFVTDTTSTRPVTFSPSSTVQAVSAPGTGSTVEAHLISTTSTIPTSFSTSSTIQVGGTVSPGALEGSIRQSLVILTSADTPYALPSTKLANRKTLVVRNLNSSTIYIGDSNVSTSGSSMGLPLKQDEVLTLDAGMDVYAVSSLASATVSILEMS